MKRQRWEPLDEPEECPRDERCLCVRHLEPDRGISGDLVKFTAAGLKKVAGTHGTWQGCYGHRVASDLVWSYGWGFAPEPNSELSEGVHFEVLPPQPAITDAQVRAVVLAVERLSGGEFKRVS